MSIDRQNIKWVGLIVALFLAYLGALNLHKKLNLNLTTVAFFNGLLIYITASGIDAINHNIKISDKSSPKKEASFLPFTDGQIWWAPKELEDSITALKEIVKIKNLEILKLRNELQIIKKGSQFDNNEKDSDKTYSSNTNATEIKKQIFNNKVSNSNIKSTNQVYVGYKTVLVNGKHGLVNNNDTLIKPIYDKIIPYNVIQFSILLFY